MRGPFCRALVRILARHPTMTAAERSSINTCITETICPQLAGNELWQRAQQADAVYVKEPVDALIQVCGIATEMRAIVGSILNQSDKRRAEEIKLTLDVISEQYRTRSMFQAQLYI